MPCIICFINPICDRHLVPALPKIWWCCLSHGSSLTSDESYASYSISLTDSYAVYVNKYNWSYLLVLTLAWPVLVQQSCWPVSSCCWQEWRPWGEILSCLSEVCRLKSLGAKKMVLFGIFSKSINLSIFIYFCTLLFYFYCKCGITPLTITWLM